MTTASVDLMKYALDELDHVHDLKRHALQRRAPVFAGIEATLSALGVTLNGVALMPLTSELRYGMDDDLFVFAVAPATAITAMPEDCAGLRRIDPRAACAVTLFEHPTQKWMLHVTWIAATAEAVAA